MEWRPDNTRRMVGGSLNDCSIYLVELANDLKPVRLRRSPRSERCFQVQDASTGRITIPTRPDLVATTGQDRPKTIQPRQPTIAQNRARSPTHRSAPTTTPSSQQTTLLATLLRDLDVRPSARATSREQPHASPPANRMTAGPTRPLARVAILATARRYGPGPKRTVRGPHLGPLSQVRVRCPERLSHQVHVVELDGLLVDAGRRRGDPASELACPILGHHQLGDRLTVFVAGQPL
jgi:hypothetical protein